MLVRFAHVVSGFAYAQRLIVLAYARLESWSYYRTQTRGAGIPPYDSRAGAVNMAHHCPNKNFKNIICDSIKEKTRPRRLMRPMLVNKMFGC